MEDRMEDPTEALGDAWASFDGNLRDFRRGKTAKRVESYGGHYAGYMAEAAEMQRRLLARGWRLAPVPQWKPKD